LGTLHIQGALLKLQMARRGVGRREFAMYRKMLGHSMTFKLQRRILPGLVWNQEVYGQRIFECLEHGQRWLDFGCGKRLLAGGLEQLESELARTPFVGLDLSLENLRAQQHTRRCVLADGNYLPFKNDSFDLITSNMVVEHLKEPDLAFAELNRVLAPGGTILLHTPNLANYLVFTNRLVSAVLPRRVHAALVGTSEMRTETDIYPTFYRANTRGTLRKLASSIGEVTLEFLPGPRPFFHHFAPVAAIELLMTRLSQTAPFRRFGTTLLVSIRKPGAARGQAIPVLETSAQDGLAGPARGSAA